MVVSTAVNGIPDYIKHQQNGLLIDETNEEAIVEKDVALLRYIIAHPEVKTQLGHQAHLDAAALFSKEVFCTTYRKILLEETQNFKPEPAKFTTA